MHKSNKTILLILICLLFLFLLSGCSFSDLMSRSTGIINDPDYQTWEKLNDDGKLDKEGKFTSDPIHVSFANNSYLDVHYFKDQDLITEFDDDSAILFPGDMIYASVSPKNDSKDLYLFDRLEVIEYTSKNERSQKLDWHVGDSLTSLMVPYEYKGTEVAIEPAGHFGERTMILEAYLSDRKTRAGGEWIVDKDSQKAGILSLNALDTYYVEYKYDPKKYYYVSSKPDCWKQDNDAGRIVFDPSGAKTGEEHFEVVLDPYLTADVTVEDGRINEITSEDNAIEFTRIEERKYSISRLKEDSIFTVNTSSKNPGIKCSIETKTIKEPDEEETEGRKYYLSTVELGSESKFVFIPSAYKVEHGKLRFIYNGQEIEDRTVCNSKKTITVEAAETEEGYWLPDNGIEIEINGNETGAELNKIQFYPKKLVTVLLDKPSSGGTVRYYVEDQELTDQTAELYCGTKITVKADADEGWDTNISESVVYIVPEQNNQTITFGEKGINDIFTQKDAYKPSLIIHGDSNLGDICKITVRSKGYSVKNELIKGRTFETKHIGTDESIRITFSSMDFGTSDNAVLITATKKTKDNKEYKLIQYVNKANGTVEIPFTKDVHYKEVYIDLKAVTGEYFHIIPFENTVSNAWFSDNKFEDNSDEPMLSSDSFIHDDRRIKLEVQPMDGYFMDGSDTYIGVYKKNNISYRDYKAQIRTIVSERLKKLVSLNLITDDPYGTVEYRIDGIPCSDSVRVIAGKKIAISYRLANNSEYKIVYKNPDFWTQALSWTGAVNNDNSGTIEFAVGPDMEGQTITREQYFDIQKKEVN